MKRRLWLSAALIPLSLAGGALAQVPTDRGPLRLVVGFPAGGSADVLARTIADKLKHELGVPVVVDNRAGAGGTIAADYVKSQPGDGLTLLLGTTHMMVMAPLTMKTVRYDAARDFKPVIRLSSFQETLTIPAATPAKTLKAWLDLAHANPQYASYGVPAPGSLPQFIGYRLGEQAKVKLLPVPYKGTAPLTQDLLGGQIAAGVLPVADMAQYHGERVRILAINGTRRSPRLPDVPTLKELGFGEFDHLEWTGLFVPRSTPDDTVRQLEAAAARVAAMPEVQEALQKLGSIADPSPGSTLTQAIANDIALWAPVVKSAGFSAD
ncbi:tripartite tricarboxylate transporter substrate-binding protein [Ottowia sp.]|uniref:tripartite tricarboxylate transporter substrate-binding protein n=1 Tax=Ottowia sp. TaxID=1898956 RepID=UPI0039E56847